MKTHIVIAQQSLSTNASWSWPLGHNVITHFLNVIKKTIILF